jgi:arylformamidase
LARYIDISLSLSPDLPVWPGDPAFEIERIAEIERDGCNLTRIAGSAHSGTHVDAPLHFLPDGDAIDRVDLEALIGPARVFDLPEAPVIDAAILDSLDWPSGLARALFRTRNGRLWDRQPAPFQTEFTAIDSSGAQWLADRGPRLIGIDYLSIAPWQELEAPHRILLSAGIIPLEGLDLRQVRPGDYELICLPLKLVGADGAPARAVLVAEGSASG